VSAPKPWLSDAVESLSPFVDAGVLDTSSVQVADLIARSVPLTSHEVLLGAALATRAPLLGHVCVVIEDVARSIFVDQAQAPSIASLPWPDPQRWARELDQSPAVRNCADEPGDLVMPLVWDGTRLYLERYWRFEDRVAQSLMQRARTRGGLTQDSKALSAIVEKICEPSSSELQRKAIVSAMGSRLTIIAGGPGTGKTRTIAQLAATAHAVSAASGRRLELALAAPTGMAAARMTEAVREQGATDRLDTPVRDALAASEATTLHRLLGMRHTSRPHYDRSNPLPHDMVIVDETSMVSLPLMARLADAVRPDATLVLVGDPFQLASVEAGAVLGEIVGHKSSGPLSNNIVTLERVHRFRADSPIAVLATAIRSGDADGAINLLREEHAGELSWVADDDRDGIAELYRQAATSASEAVRLARGGQAKEALLAASRLKVLCATRFGPLGVFAWSAAIEDGVLTSEERIGQHSYVGRPVIVTRNDYANKVFNGDVGIVTAGAKGPIAVFLDSKGELRGLAVSQLGDIDTWWASTIHKAQGSQFERVIVSLPRAPSPILTRELLYTAVTRAKNEVVLVASQASLCAAIEHPATRASGLAAKLWP